jgi:lipase
VTAYRRTTVPVPGGDLTVGLWGTGSRVVLALHGVTSTHLAWQWVAAHLLGEGNGGNGSGDLTLVAPDLRGRGGSGPLPGPYGMAVHAADCVAILDALGVGDALVAGHSMGGYAALVLADRYPDRVSRLVLVDGGPPLPPPLGDTPEEKLAAVIGPAADRLRMRFPDREAYRNFWRPHPAFKDWSPSLQSYLDYDLVDAGDGSGWRSSANVEAIRGDSEDLFEGDALPEAWLRMTEGNGHDAVFLRAETGMLAAPPALYPDPAPIEAVMPVHTVAGTNHYTILFGDAGAAAVAKAIASY